MTATINSRTINRIIPLEISDEIFAAELKRVREQCAIEKLCFTDAQMIAATAAERKRSRFVNMIILHGQAVAMRAGTDPETQHGDIALWGDSLH